MEGVTAGSTPWFHNTEGTRCLYRTQEIHNTPHALQQSIVLPTIDFNQYFPEVEKKHMRSIKICDTSINQDLWRATCSIQKISHFVDI